MKTNKYQPRWYRQNMISSSLHSFVISYKETDLWIGVNHEVSSNKFECDALNTMVAIRTELEEYITRDNLFLQSLQPCILKENSPRIAKMMADAAAVAEVGPMAAVAGAFSQCIAESLEKHYDITDLIIENGGDIYLLSQQSRRIAIYAGTSPLSNRIGIEVASNLSPLGICTSSGTVGHSLSFGKADAVTILAKQTSVADAYATAIGNMIKNHDSIDTALEYSATQKDILGIVIIVGDKIGFRGNIKIIKMQ